MYKIAIVEDEPSAASQLQMAIEAYGNQNQIDFHVVWFQEGLSFMSEYHAEFDIIFLDIQLPGMDGMEIARQIRAVDGFVCICFVTNMEQYAIRGYEVEARDFLLKPIDKFNFNNRLNKLLAYCNKTKTGFFYSIQTRFENYILNAQDIIYVEVFRHHLTYHTTQGNYEARGTMNGVEKALSGSGLFGRCHTSYLVNFSYITKFSGTSVHLGTVVLPVGRVMREPFLKALNRYVATL